MSCCTPHIHVDDIGTAMQIEVTTQDPDTLVCSALDISGATSQTITIRQPDGTSRTAAATFVTDGTDGQMEILSILGDFPSEGPGYRYQGHVVFTAGVDEKYTAVLEFEVFPNL